MCEVKRDIARDHCTELANKNKIFLVVSGNADKNDDGASDSGRFTKGDGGALLRVMFFLNPPFFGLPGIPSYS